MNRPPPLAIWVLRVTVPEPYLELILADLGEENRSRRWNWWQCLRSAFAISAMQLKQAEWQWTLLAVVAACTLPMLLVDAGWSYVLSQIPLKAGLNRGLDFLICELAIACCSAMLA